MPNRLWEVDKEKPLKGQCSKGDLNGALGSFREVIQKTDLSDQPQKEAAFAPYMMVLVCYKKLGDRGGFDRTKEELISYYPERKSQLEGAVF